MIYHFIRWWATTFLRLYFRKTIVHGTEHIPREGPLIVASNHPSAFMEASVLATVIGRPLHFLVRGDMFHPKFRWLFNWTNQIPIYRQKDGISNLRKNASSFDLTYRKLAEGNAVLIFPEAKTTLEKRMRPIQRGTAHLAFGTLPFMKEGEKLPILPVGVNFTDPRIPGTDVVIKIGKPFFTREATREDRDAIEMFTDTLSASMGPLIIQIDEHGYEHHYDVLASVYMRFMSAKQTGSEVFDDLARISQGVNDHATNKKVLEEVHDYIHTLKKHHLQEIVYFPDVMVMSKLALAGMAFLKALWLLAGGWIWRGARYLIFSKLKTITFQGPTSVGVAMVVYPLIAVLFVIASLVVGLPAWYVMIWLLVMASGMLFRPPLHLIWKTLSLRQGVKNGFVKQIEGFRKGIEDILSTKEQGIWLQLPFVSAPLNDQGISPDEFKHNMDAPFSYFDLYSRRHVLQLSNRSFNEHIGYR